MARKFLYAFAGLITLVLAAALIYRIWGAQLISAVMVPNSAFAAVPPLDSKSYEKPEMWLARPDMDNNPSVWTPRDMPKDAPVDEKASVFFIHPTSYITMKRDAAWNMALDDQESLTTARRFVQGQASVFNAIGNIWAPIYRQANYGAFLTDKPEATEALKAAYNDVAVAFDAFLQANPKGPIILAAHSQGSRHLIQLLHEKVAGEPVLDRIVAAYIIGWPVSIEADIPALGLPACVRLDQSRCILSWQSYAEPADPSPVEKVFSAGEGFDGKPRKGTHILCTNPLNGTLNGNAPASANRGTLDAREEGKSPKILPGLVPARCDANGFLLIGEPVDMGPFVLPGNNYHVYDYALFWGNVREDARQRLNNFLKK